MSVQKGRILIVDDEQGIRELLISEFKRLGYEVFNAVNGEDAISKLHAEKVDVIITDMKMPKVDGLDILKFAKENTPETEVILITGYATLENALEAMRSGAYDFIQKPFNIDELSALVEKAMEKTELKLLVALYESTNAIFSSLRLEDLFPIMTSLIKKVTFSYDALIFLLDNNNQLYPASSSLSRYDSRGKEIDSMVSRIYENEAKRNEPTFFNTENPPKELEGIFDPESEIKSVLAYPIILNNNLMGYLVLTKTASMSYFVRSDLKNVSVFVSQIAQSITNTKLYENLEVKIAELEQALQDLDNAEKKVKTLESFPNAHKMEGTAAFISEKAEYIASMKDIPQSAVNAAKEIKDKASQCLQDITEAKK